MTFKQFFFWDTSDIKDTSFKNEVMTNRSISWVLINTALVAAVGAVLNAIGVFKNDFLKTQILCGVVIFFAFTGWLYCFLFSGRRKYIKYVMLTDLLAITAAISCTLSFFATLFIVVPIICVTRYYRFRYLVIVASVSLLIIFGAPFLWPLIESQANLNLFGRDLPSISAWIETGALDYWDYVRRGLLYMQLPTGLIFSSVAVYCFNSHIRGKALVNEAVSRYAVELRLSSELSVASSIQSDMLPKHFPSTEDYAIYASMTPAKEVGGDLYDFFSLDESHIALIIADVSGKGIPASLFMATAKTLFKDQIALGVDLSVAASKINDRLCDGNSAGLFVTAWFGVLDLKTGMLRYVNAGHNPIAAKLHGEWRFLKDISGPAFGYMEGLSYKVMEEKLVPGDDLFLYTDGVTEANNPQEELFGETRLLRCLSAGKQGDPKAYIESVAADLTAFAAGKEQFDDITMLAFSFFKSSGEAV